MKTRLPVLAAIAFVMGCAATAPKAGPKFVGLAALPLGFETKTLYATTISTPTQIVFQRGKLFVSCTSRIGTAWLKPHGTADTSGGSITTPIPAANTLVDGWIRLGAAEFVTWGKDPASSLSEAAPPTPVVQDTITFIDVWPEVSGDVVCIGH